MILEWQPLLGRGSSRADDINVSGVSLVTRFLFATLMGKEYAGKKHAGRPLHNLIDCMAEEFKSAFYEAIPVKSASWTSKLFLICLGMKGDLQAIIKIGKLKRNFMRDTSVSAGRGICHLCCAGQEGHMWHDTSFSNMSRMKSSCNEPPWDTEPSLTAKIPVAPDGKPAFFKIDLFHVLLKGVYGDMAANAIATIPDFILVGFFLKCI